jgi:hypothetical protein
LQTRVSRYGGARTAGLVSVLALVGGASDEALYGATVRVRLSAECPEDAQFLLHFVRVPQLAVRLRQLVVCTLVVWVLCNARHEVRNCLRRATLLQQDFGQSVMRSNVIAIEDEQSRELLRCAVEVFSQVVNRPDGKQGVLRAVVDPKAPFEV